MLILEFAFIRSLQALSRITRALVLSLGVCYQARLRNREEFRAFVAGEFTGPCALSGGAQQIGDEIDRLVLNAIDLDLIQLFSACCVLAWQLVLLLDNVCKEASLKVRCFKLRSDSLDMTAIAHVFAVQM